MSAALVESRKLTPQVVSMVRRSRFNPLRSLSPELLSRQIDQFNVGWLRDFALMGDAIRHRDDMIPVALGKLEKGVSRHGYQVLVNDGLDPAQQEIAHQHREALKYFFDHCTATAGLDRNQSGGFRLLVQQMMGAAASRYAVHEIVWEPRVDPLTGESRLTATFIQVPLWFFENVTGRLRFVQSYYGSLEGQDMQPDEWLVTVGEGLMEPLAVAYMFKSMASQDENSYSEKFGTPGLLGKTSAAKGSDGWQAMVDAVAAFGQDWAAVVNLDAQIELIEAKGGAASTPFPAIIERMNRAIATLCRGADLSTISAVGGAGQGASLQGGESDLLEQDYAEAISETLQCISRKVISWLFGTDTPLAYVRIVIPERKNTEEMIKKFTYLVGAGVPVGVSYARQELGVPPPAPDEEVLKAVTVPSPFAPPATFTAANSVAQAKASLFNAAALRSLKAAQVEALRPLIERVLLVADLPDAEFDAGLAQLRTDLPAIAKQVLSSDASGQLTQAWDAILGTAFVSGAATAAQKQQAAS
jgi:phage gp29-like protein